MNTEGLDFFVAYSRRDAEVLEELKNHISVLERVHGARFWYDGMIAPGQEWENTIKEHLFNADIILLLISASFIASPYCYNKEMRYALELHKEGKTTVIPIIAKSCLWEETPFGQLQALPKDGIPIKSNKWDTEETPFYEITKALREIMLQSNNANSSEKVGNEKNSSREKNSDRPVATARTSTATIPDKSKNTETFHPTIPYVISAIYWAIFLGITLLQLDPDKTGFYSIFSLLALCPITFSILSLIYWQKFHSGIRSSSILLIIGAVIIFFWAFLIDGIKITFREVFMAWLLFIIAGAF